MLGWGRRTRALLMAGAAGLTVVAASTAMAPAVAGPALNSNVSPNWSGYEVTLLQNGGVSPATSVSATWTVPAVSQHTPGQAEASSTWVGIGGGCFDPNCVVADSTLVQAGTTQAVDSSGEPSYSAWWEVIPAPSITSGSVKPNPGDSVTVSISQGAIPETWDITITDHTNGQSEVVSSDQTPLPYPSDYSTADYILETPVVVADGGLAPLPSITSPVNFDKASLNGHNPGFNASEELVLVDANGQPEAMPSGTDPDRDGFNVCAYASSCGAPTSG